MSSTNLSVAAQNSTYLDSLIKYINDVKPYRTKVAATGAVSEEYIFSDNINVKIDFKEFMRTFLGADTVPRFSDDVRVRNRLSRGWHSEYVSDAIRRAFPLANVSYPKLSSHSSLHNFVAGVHDYLGIPGLNLGAFDQVRWDRGGTSEVRKNGQIQQDGWDFILSHGVYSFDTTGLDSNGIPHWIQHDLNNAVPSIKDLQGAMDTGDILNTDTILSQIPQGSLAAYAAFNDLPGNLAYVDVIGASGSLRNISGQTYEEFYAECIALNPTVLEIYSPNEATPLGTVEVGNTFTLIDNTGATRIQFDFLIGGGQTGDAAAIGDRFEIIPFNKITVAPDAGEETWSLIKSNPIALASKPLLTPASARTHYPDISIHTRSLENTPAGTWSIVFIDEGNYTLTGFDELGNPLPGYPKSVSLIDGCSYEDRFIAFTIHPVDNGFFAGDVFTWEVSNSQQHYKVYGSVSGWTKDIYTNKDAQIGKYFWNGKIGFKIPKLEMFISHGTQAQIDPDPEIATVSVMAEPSVYTITITQSSDSVNGVNAKATVQNNIRGYGKNLETGKLWSDGWVAFTLTAIPGIYEYSVGDVIKLYVAPADTRISQISGYETREYDVIGYDSGIKRPLIYEDSLFPLYHSYGAAIFEDISIGDNVEIDKVFTDLVQFKIEGASTLHPELAAVNDWLPLYFKYSDNINNVFSTNSTEPAHFADYSHVIEAFSASTGERVFYIRGVRYEKTNRAANSIIVIDRVFFNKYLTNGKKFNIAVWPDNNYGQTIRVKISEALKIYTRIHLNLKDISFVNISETSPTAITVISEVFFGEGPITGYWRWEDGSPPTMPAEDGAGSWRLITPFNSPDDQAWTYPFNISVAEGGAVVADLYDTFPYDVIGYDINEAVPFWQIYKNDVAANGSNTAAGNPDLADSSITDSLQILSVDVFTNNKSTTLTFDYEMLQPAGSTVPGNDTGLVIPASSASDEFNITLVNSPSTPTNILFAEDGNLSTLMSVPAVLTTYELTNQMGMPVTATDPNSVTFTAPGSLSYPIRVWIV